MQLMEITLRSPGCSLTSSRTILVTRAVFPVPGEPEMNMEDGTLPFIPVPSMKGLMKSRMASRSVSRPVIGICVLLQVERSKVRIRAWRGNKQFGGVGGGVAMDKREIAVEGVDGGRDEADTER